MITPFGPFEYRPQTGSRSRGHTYERRVARHLRPLVEDLGWTFYDHHWVSHGTTWLQPDFLIITPSCAVVLEAKLTNTDCIYQTAKYIRLVSLELSLPTWAAQVCRNLTPRSPKRLCTDFYDLEPGATWHLFL